MDAVHNILSIRLQPDGFSFSIHNALEDGSYVWREVGVSPGSDYNERLKDRLLGEESLLQDYKKTHITLATPRFIVVPAAVPDELGQKMFRCSLSEDPDHETILHELHAPTETTFYYGIDDDILHFLNRTFQDLVFHHALGTLHTYFADKSKIGNNAKMIVQVCKSDLSILIYQNGRLQLANMYVCQEPDNAVYYLLNTWAQCALDYEQDLLILTGDKPRQAVIGDKLKPFIRHIQPAVFPTQLFNLGQDSLNAPWDDSLLALYGF